MSDKTFKVELTSWDIERLVLGLVQMARTVPHIDKFKCMEDLFAREIELAMKLDKLLREEAK